MKKLKEFKLYLIIMLVLILLFNSGCEKNAADNYKRFLGTWISNDLVDTLEFKTEHDLYKNVGIPKDHFNYSVFGDSITIQYKGVLFILIQPTTHYYKFSGDKLFLDLEHCYGFRSQTISFTKK